MSTDADREVPFEDTARALDAMAASGVATWFWDRARDEIVWDGDYRAIYGDVFTNGACTLDELLTCVHVDDRAEVAATLMRARDAGEPCSTEHRVVTGDGLVRRVIARGRPRAFDGADGLAGVVVEVTDERRAQESSAEQTGRGLAFLLETSLVLEASLEPAVTLQQLARVCVPTLGDQCLVDLFDGDRLADAAVVALDAGVEETLRELRRRWTPSPENPNPAWRVRRTGASELFRSMPDDMWRRIAQDDDHLALLRSVAPTSGITAPLVARGRVLGAISLGARESGRVYGEADVTLLEELGRRAGIALDNARLYTDQATVAAELQRALLPPGLPSLPALEVTARYLAAGVTEVGGDFYDAMVLEDGRVLVVVGDVVGKGPRAAAMTGVARHSLRAVARYVPDPGALLAVLDRALREESLEDALCTVVVALVTPRDGGCDVKLALGGHPPPVHVRRDGTTELVGVHGPLLGAELATSWPDASVRLAAGDMFVMYTDGVTERRRGRQMFGDENLLQVVRDHAGASADTVADEIVTAVRRFSSSPLADDLAVLVLRVP
jgi:serine phosphatase RsbU (regulator of sigma subunit)